jgi:hypothetical protein
MSEEFECRCIYVEVSNDAVPRSGRLEYRARSCEICRARGALQRISSRAVVAFGCLAPRYQRVH